MAAYYNEIDPYAAQWLRNLIAAGHIAPGDVDERSIVDVRANDLRGYQQAHFFAGIGGWSYALRLAGWPDDRPVWTGSCPCQPFSAAGKGAAADDERHLWPAWFSLIAQCGPGTIFSEQVEAAIGWGWIDAVFSDLEAQGYACGSAVLPACGIGAPHIRQRLWFVGHADGSRLKARDAEPIGTGTRSEQSSQSGSHIELADANGGDAGAEGLQRRGKQRQLTQDGRTMRMGNTDDARSQRRGIDPREHANQCTVGAASEPHVLGNTASKQMGRARQPWQDCVWLPCTDGKARPVEPGTFPLAHGIPGRVGRLRAYGNAIVPQVAAEFIQSVMKD
jgi:DNA (cytosine-5)-methyltransferase 1